jgi:hypothetical protein
MANSVQMVAGMDISAECHKVDRYRRQFCEVWVPPPTAPPALRRGTSATRRSLPASWNREYPKEHSAEERTGYELAEQEA